MFEFTRKNPDKLEGKVLVYAENLALCGDSDCALIKYPTLYSALNPLDIKNIGELLRENFPKEKLEKEEKILQELFKKMESGKIYPISQSVGALNSLDDLNDLKDLEIDIINGGKVNCISSAYDNLKGITQSYIINYIAQLESELKTKDNLKPTFNDHYSTYSGETFRRKMHYFVGTLIDASDDSKRFDQVKSNIASFTKNSPFLGDIANLVGIAQTNIPGKFELMNFYIEKIIAIQEDDFEKAGKFKNKIDEFLKK